MTKPANFSWMSPYIIVKDVDKAMDFYKRAFGFEQGETMTEDGVTNHGEMFYKGQSMMFGREDTEKFNMQSPSSSNTPSPVGMYLYTENVDAFYDKAIAEGAESSQAPEDMFWPDRMCRLIDLDGYGWSFATHKGS